MIAPTTPIAETPTTALVPTRIFPLGWFPELLTLLIPSPKLEQVRAPALVPAPIFKHHQNRPIATQDLGLWEGDILTELREVKEPRLKWKGAPIPAAFFDQMLGFYRFALKEWNSEVMLRLAYNHQTQSWRIFAYPQTVRSGLEVKELETMTPEQQALRDDTSAWLGPDYAENGSSHSHCRAGAFQSGTDLAGELKNTGVHITLGNVDTDKPSVHGRVVFRGIMYAIDWKEWFEGWPEGISSTAAHFNLVPGADLSFPDEWKARCFPWTAPAVQTWQGGYGYGGGSTYGRYHNNGRGFEDAEYWGFDPNPSRTAPPHGGYTPTSPAPGGITRGPSSTGGVSKFKSTSQFPKQSARWSKKQQKKWEKEQKGKGYMAPPWERSPNLHGPGQAPGSKFPPLQRDPEHARGNYGGFDGTDPNDDGGGTNAPDERQTVIVDPTLSLPEQYEQVRIRLYRAEYEQFDLALYELLTESIPLETMKDMLEASLFRGTSGLLERLYDKLTDAEQIVSLIGDLRLKDDQLVKLFSVIVDGGVSSSCSSS